MQSVYVLDAGDVRKVGIAIDPEDRCAVLGRAGFSAKLVWRSLPLANALAVETVTHKLLWAVGHHVERELFCSSVRECIAAIKRAQRILGGVEPNDLFSQHVLGNSKSGFSWKKSTTVVTFLADEELNNIIDDLRCMCGDGRILSKGEAVGIAILNYRDSLKSKIAAQERRKQ